MSLVVLTSRSLSLIRLIAMNVGKMAGINLIFTHYWSVMIRHWTPRYFNLKFTSSILLNPGSISNLVTFCSLRTSSGKNDVRLVSLLKVVKGKQWKLSPINGLCNTTVHVNEVSLSGVRIDRAQFFAVSAVFVVCCLFFVPPIMLLWCEFCQQVQFQ